VAQAGDASLGRCELIMVRHGQARSPHGTYGADTPLTALGHAQARAVGTALRGTSIAAVYVSPYVRALQTAQPIGAALNLPLVEDARLRELESMHEDEAFDNEAVSERIIRAWQPNDAVREGLEKRKDFAGRVAASVEDISRKHLDQTVVLVAHGGTVDAAVRWLGGVGAESAWQHFLSVQNASMTRAHYWPQGHGAGGPPRYAQIVTPGDVSHLAAHLRSEH
jgi:probable phosphoglycerate mutase